MLFCGRKQFLSDNTVKDYFTPYKITKYIQLNNESEGCIFDEKIKRIMLDVCSSLGVQREEMTKAL